MDLSTIEHLNFFEELDFLLESVNCLLTLKISSLFISDLVTLGLLLHISCSHCLNNCETVSFSLILLHIRLLVFKLINSHKFNRLCLLF